MQFGFCFDIVGTDGLVVFQLSSSVSELLLIRWGSFFFLDFVLDVFDGVRVFNLHNNRLTHQSEDADRKGCLRVDLCGHLKRKEGEFISFATELES